MTQNDIAIRCIKDYGYIDRVLAFQEGIANITAVISELRSSGVPIITNRIKYKNRKGEKKIKTEWRLGQ